MSFGPNNRSKLGAFASIALPGLYVSAVVVTTVIRLTTVARLFGALEDDDGTVEPTGGSL